MYNRVSKDQALVWWASIAVIHIVVAEVIELAL